MMSSTRTELIVMTQLVQIDVALGPITKIVGISGLTNGSHVEFLAELVLLVGI
jgi:hypothetical protein